MKGRKQLGIVAGLVLAVPMAFGYGNFTFVQQNQAGSTQLVPAKYDLGALSGNTVSYFVSSQGPRTFLPGDNFAKLTSQLQAAAAVWNAVPSSNLRVAFGGVGTVGAPQSTPGIDIVFDDSVPPGLKAYTSVTFAASYPAGAPFVPIQRATMHFNADLVSVGQASYQDTFFLVMVHEFGHALGLQHTLTSGAMATEYTRATSKAAPLAADDVAGISLLYPTAAFAAGTGTIFGKVTQSGVGVNLASVVAISPTTGVAVSALSGLDGSYQIAGVPPGQYIVYAHPLPLALPAESYPDNVVPPMDAQGNSFPANTTFSTSFYPGTRDWTQAKPINVVATISAGSVDFAADTRVAPGIAPIATYGFQGNNAVAAPPFHNSQWLVFNAPATLGASVVGFAASLRAGTQSTYTQGYSKVVVDPFNPSAAAPVPIAFTSQDDLYVLPGAFFVVPSAPPSISGAAGTTDRSGNTTVTISGANFAADTRVWFDGAAAAVTSWSPTSVTVSAPFATTAYSASVVALASDGQSSAQGLGSAAPVSFVYNGAPSNLLFGVAGQSAGTLTAGTDAWLDVTAYGGLSFGSQVSVGFGSSDITVRKVWNVNPSLVRVNLSVAPGTQPGLVSVTVSSGLQLISFSNVQVQSPAAPPTTLRGPAINQATGLAGIPWGGTALVGLSNPPQDLTGWTITVDNQQASFTALSNGQIGITVPNSFVTGPVVVRLNDPNGNTISSILMQIDSPPPVVQAIATAAGVATSSFHAGDIVFLTVSGILDANGVALPGFQLVLNGTVTPAAVVPDPSGNGIVQFKLSPNLSSGAVSGFVQVDTRVSVPFTLTID